MKTATVGAWLDRRAARIAILLFGYALSVPFVIGAVDAAGPIALFDALPCWTLLAVGYVAWSARPASRTGFLMMLAGVGAAVWPGGGYEPLLYTARISIGSAWVGVAVHLMLAFPGGRLRSRRERLPAVAVYLIVLIVIPAQALFTDPTETCADCRPGQNLLFVSDGLGAAQSALVVLVQLAAAIWVFTVLLARWREASMPARRVLRPVLIAGLVAAAANFSANAAYFALGTDDYEIANAPFALELVIVASDIAASLAALGFLAGLLRTRVTRSTMGQLLVSLATMPASGSLRDHLARALGDDRLRVGFYVRDTEGYVTEDGSPLALDDDRAGVTPVERHGEPLAVLVHDPALNDDEGLVEAVVAAAMLALENERLKAEVRVQLAAVRESRARILAAGDRERERIERELQEGAQQRLESLASAVRLAHERATTLRANGAAEILVRAGDEAALALEDLRELARGLHPAALAQDGLRTALEQLAERSPVPVELDGLPDQRVDERAEACAYFVCSEALANVAKYSQASRAWISARLSDGTLRVEVSDDGVGGADPDAGSGLRGLHDRVEAVGGTLRVDSPPGEGTRLLAEIPTTAASGLTLSPLAGVPR